MKIRVVFSEMVDQLTYDMVEKGVVSSYFSYWVAFDPSSLESGLYTGPVNADYYGRLVPKHVTASVRMQGKTASTETVMSAMLESFDRKVCRHIFVRRIYHGIMEHHNYKGVMEGCQATIIHKYNILDLCGFAIPYIVQPCYAYIGFCRKGKKGEKKR